jgi:ASC-1-like (ASCH) protein
MSRRAEEEIKVSEPWFGYIGNGTKTWEGRLNKGRFSYFDVGTRLKVILEGNPSKYHYLEIVEIRLFDTFEDALMDIGIEQVLPGIDSYEEGVRIYEQFYPMEDQQRYGVVMFRLH